MPLNTTPIEVESKEDLYRNLDKVRADFEGPGIAVIRGIQLSRDEQIQLVRDLGDLIGWYPNNASQEILHKYQENHSASRYLESSGADEVILDWHLEHVDYDSFVPLVGGVWNMFKFTCDSNVGKTYFLDSCEAYKFFTEEEQEFLKKITLVWNDVDGSGPHYAPVVVNHWISGDPLIRIEITKQVDPKISDFEGREATNEEISTFSELKNKFHGIVDWNEDLRIVHRWQQGDIVIPDLYRMAHAVTGGFDPSEREFWGFWLFSKNPENRSQEEMPTVWRDEWARRDEQ